MLPTFKLKSDWYIETDMLGIKNRTLIFCSGQLFKPTESAEYYICWGGWSETTPHIGGRIIQTVEEMRLAKGLDGELLFEELHDSIKMTVSEISIDEEEVVKSWRIQLDVKTSQKKLKEIQKILESTIKEALN